MNQKQIDALRLMIRAETKAAMLETELLLHGSFVTRLSRPQLEAHIQQLRDEARVHGKEAVEP